MRRCTVLVVVLVLMVSCSGVDTEPTSTPTTQPDTSTTQVASTPAPPTTALSTSTTIAEHRPGDLLPTDLQEAELEWLKGEIAVDRGAEVALARLGESLIVAEWSRTRGLWIRTSPDGLAWSQPVQPAGVPDTFQPDYPFLDLWVQGGGAGVMVFGDIERGGPGLLTSVDGVTWIVQPFTAGTGAVGDMTFFHMADGTREAMLSSDGGRTWDAVGLPGRAPEYAVVFAIGDRFYLVGGGGPVLAVDHEGVEAIPMPVTPDPLIQDGTAWRDGLALVVRGQIGGSGWRFALLGLTRDEWVEYPVPFFPDRLDWQNADYWNVQTTAAGDGGVLLVAFYPPEDFDFRGEAFKAIELPIAGLDASLFGDNVIAYVGRGQMRELEWSFDDAGTLTVWNGPDGDLLGNVTCDELRAAARRDPVIVGELVGWPEIRIGWSPDGTAWTDRAGEGIFGAGAYVRQVVALGDGFAALVIPNGEASIPDPPNCALGMYPPELPFEVWVGRPSQQHSDD